MINENTTRLFLSYSSTTSYFYFHKNSNQRRKKLTCSGVNFFFNSSGALLPPESHPILPVPTGPMKDNSSFKKSCPAYNKISVTFIFSSCCNSKFHSPSLPVALMTASPHGQLGSLKPTFSLFFMLLFRHSGSPHPRALSATFQCTRVKMPTLTLRPSCPQNPSPVPSHFFALTHLEHELSKGLHAFFLTYPYSIEQSHVWILG